MKFLVFIVPTFLASIFVLFAFGGLALCGMTDCLASGRSSFASVLIGVFVIAFASLPLLIVASLLYQNVRRKRLARWHKMLGWIVLAIIGGLGIFQVIIDPGDAFWAGLPMLVFSGCLALSFLNYPIP